MLNLRQDVLTLRIYYTCNDENCRWDSFRNFLLLEKGYRLAVLMGVVSSFVRAQFLKRTVSWIFVGVVGYNCLCRCYLLLECFFSFSEEEILSESLICSLMVLESWAMELQVNLKNKCWGMSSNNENDNKKIFIWGIEFK